MNGFIVPFDSPDVTLEVAGGKGANLARLTRAGLPVPPGFIITTGAYRAFVQANDLQGRIAALAADRTTTAEQASAAIRPLFAQGRMTA